jgi:type I restriction enzyme R subunit
MFDTNFSTKDTKSFYGYYKDVAKKVKDRKVDILLVVNMFLTGFDSKPLNTLYVDKNLRHHGLIQAYSRTNRILNDVKSQGNIVAFRNLKKRTDEALALFSNVDAKEDIFIPPYDEYVTLFNDVVADLKRICPEASDVKDLVDEEAELQFIKTFRELLRLKNILESYAEFDHDDLAMHDQGFADFRSAYLDLYDKVKSENEVEKVSILDDVDFELELIHRDVVNVQYILQLLAQLYDAQESEKTDIKKRLIDAISGEPELRTKKELIQDFIENNLPDINDVAEIPDNFEEFWEQARKNAFESLVKEEQLDADKLAKVIERYVYTGIEPLPDPDIIELLTVKPKLKDRKPTRERVLLKVIDYVDTFIKGAA